MDSPFYFHGRMDDCSEENQRAYYEQLALYEQMEEERALEVYQEQVAMEEYQKENFRKELLEVATDIRNKMVELYTDKYGLNLCGKCIEASDLIVEKLAKKGIEAKTVEGWCIYEDDSSCSDRCFDEHTWVECKNYYIDVTADQFNSCMINALADIYVTEDRPSCMVYEKPTFTWLCEKDSKVELDNNWLEDLFE